MDRSALGHQPFARRRTLRAPGDGLEPAAGAIGEGHPHMPALQHHRPLDAGVGDGEQRFRIARAEGRQTLEVGPQRPVGPARGHQGVDLDGVGRRRDGALLREAFAKEGAELRKGVGPHGQAGRHGVAAAGQQQAGVIGRLDRAPEVHPWLGASGSLADIGGAVDAHHDHRLAVALAQTAGDDADDARMPVIGGDQQQRLIGEIAGLLDVGDRGLLDLCLDLLARLVQAVEFRGQGRRFRWVVRGQQPRAQVGPADPPAGIDPGPQHEAHVKDGRRRLPVLQAVGDAHQGPEAGVAPAGHHLQPLGRQRPVEAGERGDVADRPHRGQVQPGGEVRLAAPFEQAATPGLPVQGRQQDECDARRREMPLPRGAVRPVRIHQRGHRRDLAIAHQVVVDHHHLEADLGGAGQGVVGGGAAVDGHHQLRALGLQAAEGGWRRAITFGDAIGDIDRQFLPHRPEPAHELGRGGGAVHVVVGEDRHRPPPLQSVHQDFGGPVHVLEGGRIGKQGLQSRIEEVVGCLRRHAARGYGSGQGLAQPVGELQLPDAFGLGRALAPEPTAQGAGDTEIAEWGPAVGQSTLPAPSRGLRPPVSAPRRRVASTTPDLRTACVRIGRTD